MRITISKENYLKAIAEAQSEGEVVKAVTLTRWLHVSAPATCVKAFSTYLIGLCMVIVPSRDALFPAVRVLEKYRKKPATLPRIAIKLLN